MNKNYIIFFKRSSRGGLLLIAATAATLLFSACNNIPTSRVHSAASIPRFVDVNNGSFVESPRAGVGMSVGTGYGLAFSDVGNVHGSEIFHVGVSYRNSRFAFGWTPYLGQAQVSLEGTGGFGSALWLALYFGGGNNWRFSYQNTYTVVKKTNEMKGCENGNFFLYTNCAGNPESVSLSEVHVKEVGFILTAEHRLHDHDSILFAPSLYWTWITTTNRFDPDPSGDYVLRTNFWSPGLQLGYVMRSGERLNMAWTLMVGAQWVKTFRPDRAVRELMPTAELKFQF